MDVATILGWGLLYGMQAAQIGMLFMMAVKHMDWECVDHHLTLKQCRSMDRTFIIEMGLHLGFCLLLAVVAPPMAFALFALHVPLVAMPIRRFMEGQWRVEPDSLWKQGPTRKKELYIKGVAQTALLVGTIATMIASEGH